MTRDHNQAPPGSAVPSRRAFLGAAIAAPMAALPVAAASASAAVAVPGAHPDAALLEICNAMSAVCDRWEELVDFDPYAPDGGPYYAEYHDCHRRYGELANRLMNASRPVTLDGVRAIARVALGMADRGSDGHLQPGDFAKWLAATALVGAAGSADVIDKPSYWPTRWSDEGDEEDEEDTEGDEAASAEEAPEGSFERLVAEMSDEDREAARVV